MVLSQDGEIMKEKPCDQNNTCTAGPTYVEDMNGFRIGIGYACCTAPPAVQIPSESTDSDETEGPPVISDSHGWQGRPPAAGPPSFQLGNKHRPRHDSPPAPPHRTFGGSRIHPPDHQHPDHHVPNPPPHTDTDTHSDGRLTREGN